jgi:hypothetical protein
VTGHIKYLRSSGLLDFFGLFGLLKVRKGLEKELGVFLMHELYEKKFDGQSKQAIQQRFMLNWCVNCLVNRILNRHV